MKRILLFLLKLYKKFISPIFKAVGIECKYYSARPKTVDFEIEGCDGIYAIGDGAGFTRSLSQAAANGLYVADIILNK